MYRFTVFFWLTHLSLFAQISPPGLGNAHDASWLAIGIRQRLDTAAHKQLVSYVGLGRISSPDDYNLLEKSSILVINNEYYNLFRKHWQYSLAVSYRRQNEYVGSTSDEKAESLVKQEFRWYVRYSFVQNYKRLKWVSTYRQEFRKFFTKDFNDWEENYQLRSRFRSQLTFRLDRRKVHHLVTTAEALFSISRASDQSWSSFEYRESRFCLYYNYAPEKSALVFSIGYMNNLIGKSSLTDVHYLALDIIWSDPFGNLKTKKKTPEEEVN